MQCLHNSIIFSLISLALLTSLNQAAAGQKQVAEFDDFIGRYNLTYPSDWKLNYNNNYDLTLIPMDNRSIDSNTFFQIRAMPQYNMSLEKHVLRNINSYMDKYATGDFVLFSISNLSDNETIDGIPAYVLEYNAIMNDNFQTPISILEYIVVHNDNLFKIKFSQGGYGINSLNKNMVNNITRSIDFRN